MIAWSKHVRTITITDIFPEIESTRVLLRKLSLADKMAIFENYSDVDIYKNFMDKPFEKIEQAENLIKSFNSEFEKKEGITWAIDVKKDRICVGTISIVIIDEESAEIGYDLKKEYWGQGIMSEALKKVIEFSRKELLLKRLKADTYTSNNRSCSLLKNNGFVLDYIEGDSSYYCIEL